MLKILDDFKTLSLAKVNWKIRKTILVGKWPKGERVPDGLKWKREGIKYLGVFVGNENVVKKKISYKGRI